VAIGEDASLRAHHFLGKRTVKERVPGAQTRVGAILMQLLPAPKSNLPPRPRGYQDAETAFCPSPAAKPLSIGVTSFPPRPSRDFCWLAHASRVSCIAQLAHYTPTGSTSAPPCLRVELIPTNLRQGPFSDYCPQGHCPNGQVTLTERSGAARADAERDYPDDDRNRGSSVPLIWIKTGQVETQRHASLPCSAHSGETPWNTI
jgi:hypothetical protein